MPVYQDFVTLSDKVKPQYLSLIMPAKWYVGGKGLDSFREKMLNDDRIKCLFDFPESREVFPSADVAGGICYFLIKEDYHGRCKFVSCINDVRKESMRNLSEHSIFVRNSDAVGVLEKVYSNDTMDSLVYSSKPFGFRTFFVGEKNPSSDSVALLGSQGISYVHRSEVKTNAELIDKWKVICSYASAQGGRADKDGMRKVLPKVEVLEPNLICSETYLLVSTFHCKEFAENAAKYLRTKFFRYLLSLRVITQHISKDSFSFIPTQCFTENSDIDWSKSVEEIDKQLYKKYHLTDTEIAFIESMIKPM